MTRNVTEVKEFTDEVHAFEHTEYWRTLEALFNDKTRKPEVFDNKMHLKHKIEKDVFKSDLETEKQLFQLFMKARGYTPESK